MGNKKNWKENLKCNDFCKNNLNLPNWGRQNGHS